MGCICCKGSNNQRKRIRPKIFAGRRKTKNIDFFSQSSEKSRFVDKKKPEEKLKACSLHSNTLQVNLKLPVEESQQDVSGEVDGEGEEEEMASSKRLSILIKKSRTALVESAEVKTYYPEHFDDLQEWKDSHQERVWMKLKMIRTMSYLMKMRKTKTEEDEKNIKRRYREEFAVIYGIKVPEVKQEFKERIVTLPAGGSEELIQFVEERKNKDLNNLIDCPEAKKGEPRKSIIEIYREMKWKNDIKEKMRLKKEQSQRPSQSASPSPSLSMVENKQENLEPPNIQINLVKEPSIEAKAEPKKNFRTRDRRVKSFMLFPGVFNDQAQSVIDFRKKMAKSRISFIENKSVMLDGNKVHRRVSRASFKRGRRASIKNPIYRRFKRIPKDIKFVCGDNGAGNGYSDNVMISELKEIPADLLKRLQPFKKRRSSLISRESIPMRKSQKSSRIAEKSSSIGLSRDSSDPYLKALRDSRRNSGPDFSESEHSLMDMAYYYSDGDEIEEEEHSEEFGVVKLRRMREKMMMTRTGLYQITFGELNKDKLPLHLIRSMKKRVSGVRRGSKFKTRDTAVMESRSFGGGSLNEESNERSFMSAGRTSLMSGGDQISIAHRSAIDKITDIASSINKRR